MVGGLLHVVLPRQVAFHVRRVGDQRVAARARFRPVKMRPVLDVLVRRVQLHGRLLQRRIVLACAVRTIDGQRIKLEFPAECVARSGRLLMARHATDAVQSQAVLEHLGHAVMRFPQVMGVEMAQRRVARRAFVLQFQLVAGVDGHLMGHLGPPEGVLGAVAHERAHPLVCGIDILASCTHVGEASLVMPMASSAHPTAREQGVGRIRQRRICREEGTAVVRVALLVQPLWPQGPRRKHHSTSCRQGPNPSRRVASHFTCKVHPFL